MHASGYDKRILCAGFGAEDTFQSPCHRQSNASIARGWFNQRVARMNSTTLLCIFNL
jgi:hypothetical protein